jgi:Ni,Fe-hydrogenase III large subunit
MTTGRVTPELAAQLGLTGLAGRASAQAVDLRCDHAWPLRPAARRMATQRGGDVAARVAVRFDEASGIPAAAAASCAPGLPRRASSPCALPGRRPRLAPAGWKAGAARCWWRSNGTARGEGRIRRCHCHDPSWQNWPVLEHAVIGNIVPDFPLINKSFNLSYSGHDL